MYPIIRPATCHRDGSPVAPGRLSTFHVRGPQLTFNVDLPGAPNDGASWAGTVLMARAATIYAGTSQIQRNILAEIVLGLPKEPRG